MNDEWKNSNDTDYVETPIDPKDPTMVELDTIVTLAKDKAPSILHLSYLQKDILKAYGEAKTAADGLVSKMDDSMKKKYKESTDKFAPLLQGL